MQNKLKYQPDVTTYILYIQMITSYNGDHVRLILLYRSVKCCFTVLQNNNNHNNNNNNSSSSNNNNNNNNNTI